MTTPPCTGCAVQQGTHQPAEAVHKIAEPDAQHLQELAAYRFTVENLQARVAELEDQLAAAPQAVQPAVPDGWVPCVITYEGQHPEEIAYGPQAMMDRLKKWLDRYFKMRTATAHPAEGVPALEVNDAMALAFHHALTDGSIGADDLEEIKIGLRAVLANVAATQPAAQGLDAQALKQSFREYLSVSEHIEAGGHVMDSIATDLTRIALAEAEVSTVIARRKHCNASGQSGEDSKHIRAAALAAQAKQGGA